MSRSEIPVGARGGWAWTAPPDPDTSPEARAVRTLAGRATYAAVAHAVAAPRAPPAAPPVAAPAAPRPSAAYRASLVGRKLRDKPSRAGLRWAKRHVLGGKRAYRQAWELVWDSILRGRKDIEEIDERRRAFAVFPSLEAHIDEGLLDAVAESLPPTDGESLEAYDDRLRGYVGAARHRTDGVPVATRSQPVARTPAPARASDAAIPQPSGPPVAVAVRSPMPPPKALVVTRRESREIRRRFWASYRRRPTQDEFDSEVRKLRAASG